MMVFRHQLSGRGAVFTSGLYEAGNANDKAQWKAPAQYKGSICASASTTSIYSSTPCITTLSDYQEKLQNDQAFQMLCGPQGEIKGLLHEFKPSGNSLQTLNVELNR